MSGPDPKAEVARLLAPSIESIIAKGLNEYFPDGHECRVTHLPLDAKTLEVICRMNLPKALVHHIDDFMKFTDHGVKQTLCLNCHQKDSIGPEESCYYLDVYVTQCDSYVNAIKAMREAVLKTYNHYRPSKDNKLGNYALESGNGSVLIWVRFTTVVELRVDYEDNDYCTYPWIDIGRIAAVLDKAMTEHEGSVSAVPKSSIDWASVPECFTVGEYQLVKFNLSKDVHSHREFKLESDNAFVVVDGTERTKGSFDTEFSVICRKKGETKLVIRTAHKSSLWPSEHCVYVENLSGALDG